MNKLIKRLLIKSLVLVLATAAILEPVCGVAAAPLPTTKITSIAAGRLSADGATELLPYIEQDFVGREQVTAQHNLVVRNMSRRTGLRVGTDLVIPFGDSNGPIPVQVLVSTTLQPGGLLVLDNALQVREIPLGISGDGTPFVVGGSDGIIVHPALADPAVVGEATAMAEMPGAVGTATLAVGTTIGGIIAILIGLRIPAVVFPVSTSPIDGLVVIPQVGHFEFAALSNGRLIGLDPDADARTPGLQPQITFNLASPRGVAAISNIGAQIQDGTSNTFTSPTPVPLVATNGTNEVLRVAIPANPSRSTTLIPLGLDRLPANITQIAVGSLVALTADGCGVLYQPGFTLQRGSSGPVFTAAGATMQIEPETLNLHSRGRWVSVSIEVANGGAASIDGLSLELEVVGVAGSVPLDPAFAPRLERDGRSANPRLAAKFSRTSVEQLLRCAGDESPSVRVSWNTVNGTGGAASATVRIIR